jgi:hypothetical protein
VSVQDVNQTLRRENSEEALRAHFDTGSLLKSRATPSCLNRAGFCDDPDEVSVRALSPGSGRISGKLIRSRPNVLPGARFVARFSLI